MSGSAALRDAAKGIRTSMAAAWGGSAMWVTTGDKVAALVATHLEELARKIAELELDPACTACDYGYPASACSTDCKCGSC